MLSTAKALAGTTIVMEHGELVIDAVVFDFDGLILDTETPHFETWRDLYLEHDQILTREAWEGSIGGTSGSFNAFHYLLSVLGDGIDGSAIKETRTHRYLSRVHAQPLLGGVEARLAEARALGLKTGVASSSSCNWIHNHLKRLGLWERFDSVACGDEVAAVKPDPAVYTLALERLGVDADKAVCFEDSPKGIEAAKRAGIYCIAVPNAMTRNLDLTAADLVVESLEHVSLEAMLAVLEDEVADAC
jgi:HAD superfamily hydrolase (TIGR01509 family)